MRRDLIQLAARLSEEGRPYALATVVRSERPTSGKPGNMALITADGGMHGWIGGSCTRSEVIRHAVEALERGEPRLLAFGAADGRADDVIEVPMSCSSGGKVDVHINPVLPAPVLFVVGGSPIARALVRLGRAVGYTAVASAPDTAEDVAAAADRYAGRPGGAKLFAVVATMGRSDERALAELAAARPDYLGVIASPTRMEEVRRILAAEGLAEDEIARVRGPAGLDIGAESPEEIAVSILAEVVATAARPAEPLDDEPEAAAASEAQATDPVCGMTVSVAGAPSSNFEGEAVYFCCEGCRTRFDAEPAAFA